MCHGDISTGAEGSPITVDALEERSEQANEATPATQGAHTLQLTMAEQQTGKSNAEILLARADRLREYKRVWKALGIKETHEAIAKEAKPTWNDRTPVNCYLRGTLPVKDVHLIEKVLAKRPRRK
jgi:hypothetical protein